MDDLLSEFLTETSENLDIVDVELVKLEQDPGNEDVLGKIFRLVHTIKGTCGFLGLPRLEAVAHASETVLGKFRDGVLPVTAECVSLILSSLDQIKELLAHLEAHETEPDGDDKALIIELDRAAEGAYSGVDISVDVDASADGMTADTIDFENIEIHTEATDAEADEASDADEASNNDETAPVIEAAEPVAKPVATAPSGGETKPRESALANQSIRVSVDVLEDLMTMVSELVLTRNQLNQMVRNQEESEFKVPLQRLSNVTSDLQDAVMKTRMQPIGNAWQKLPRIIRDLGHELDKQIELKMVGAETELDRQVLELIKDPLTHMVRNSADHGLETTKGRIAAGKTPKGTVVLSAYHEGGHIIIDIKDDGRGLDTDRILEKAIKSGLVTEADAKDLSESQIHKFIFRAGFSTAEKVTNVSGRGVGMDVVRTNIELIGGVVDVRSELGKGSTFTIKIPLTLAIVSALIVESCGQRFAVPQLSVVELVRTSANSGYKVERVNNAPVLRLRDRLLPLVYLSKVLGIEDIGGDGQKTGSEDFIIVSQVGSQTFGIVVDGVYDTEEIVVKPVASKLREGGMFSGNTILGDGSVIMIIDPNGVAAAVSDHALDTKNDEMAEEKRRSNGPEITSLLIFRAGSDQPKAVPLSVVTRLEEVDADKIEDSNGMTLVQYRGRLMPLVTISPMQSIAEEGRQAILVFTEDDNTVGLAVDEIVDIVDTELVVELNSDIPGSLGTAVVKEKATEILDVGHYLEQGFSGWFRHDQSSADAKGKIVLLVDDSPFFLNLMAPLLRTQGYEVLTADSVEKAWACIEDSDPIDLIISDLEMPDRTGFDFASELRGDDRFEQTPLIALTAHSTPQHMTRSTDAGFNEVVAKFERDRLLGVISEALANQECAA